MRLAVISDLAPGSHRAFAINVVKTAGGLARLGHEVTIYCRAPEPGWTRGEALRAYGERDLEFVCFPEPDQADARLTDDRFLRAFGAWAAGEVARRGARLVYARHTRGALACMDRGMATIFETHLPIENDWAGGASCLREARTGGRLLGVVTIGAALRDRYVALGAALERVHIVPDAVDLALFAPPGVLPASPYPADGRPRVTYAGHLYDWKGIPTLLAAAARAPDLGFHLLGGTDGDIARTREAARALGNLRVHGRVPHAEVPRWLWHADVLVLPPSGDHESAAWTSPMKLGEYIASGRPVAASRIPALRAWVGEPIARWFAPDQPDDVVRVVRRIIAEPAAERRARSALAQEWAGRFTYEARARAILEAAGEASGAGRRPLNRAA